MKAVSVVGWKKAGKTTTGLALVAALAQKGLTISVIKHSSHGFDRDDTDTDKYRELAQCVCGVSPHETFASWPDKKPLAALTPLIGSDVLVMEGGRDEFVCPRIIVCGNGNTGDSDNDLAPELAIACTGGDMDGIERVDDPAQLAALVAEKGFLLPGLDCKMCKRETCRELAADIVAGRAVPADCLTSATGLRITCGTTSIAVNPFVERIITASIRGMLAELKGYGDGPVKIELEG